MWQIETSHNEKLVRLHSLSITLFLLHLIIYNKYSKHNIIQRFWEQIKKCLQLYKNRYWWQTCRNFYFDSKNNVYPSTKLIISNTYRNPFDTIKTIFHEFCHAIETKYDGRKYSYLWKAILEREKYSKFEYNKILREDYYINHLFTTEIEADLFGPLMLLIKLININNYNTILIR